MKAEYQNLPLRVNNTGHRFEMMIEEQLAFIEYNEGPGQIALLHTQVPLELEGKGIGTAIIEKTLEYLEQQNLKLISLCSFVGAYLVRHPEWKRILVES